MHSEDSLPSYDLDEEYRKACARMKAQADEQAAELARQQELVQVYQEEEDELPPGGYEHKNNNKKRRLTVDEKLEAAGFALEEALRPLTRLQKIRVLHRHLSEQRRLQREYLDSKRRSKE